MRRSALKNLLWWFAVFWVVTYVSISIYWGTSRETTPTVDVLTLAPEVIESFCDRFSRGLLKPEALNASMKYVCERWLASQNEYFRLRESRMNWFDPGQLSITGEGICTEDTSVIILVHSLHKYNARRDAIRNTWGGAAVAGQWPEILAKENVTIGTRVQLAFIFGKLFNDEQAELRLREESKRQGDVIQGHFGESYRNMTLKSLTGLHWVSTYCASARFLLKSDDDMFINIPAIFSVINVENMTHAIMGPYNVGSPVYRKGKWAISTSDYPFFFYPPYESGSGYVISADLWRPLLDASKYVPHIFIDDVYITGILGRIVNARHVTRKGFAYATNRAPDPCAIANGSVLTGTRVDPRLQYEIWAKLVNNTMNCKRSS